jgi:hypothetical protein
MQITYGNGRGVNMKYHEIKNMIRMIQANLMSDLSDIEFDRDRKMRKCVLQKEVIIKSVDRLIALSNNLDKTDQYKESNAYCRDHIKVASDNEALDIDGTLLRAGDIVTVMKDKPQCSNLQKGARETVDSISGSSIHIRDWSVSSRFFKLYDYKL